ncbi:hypothetical protein E0K83_03885 [Gramella sp. BOM4]|nr:hypothetical protein [Christiangramia bathymodioli]
MKVVRSKRPLVYNSRDQKSAIIELRISDWTREEKLNQFKAVVEDYVIGFNEEFETQTFNKIFQKPVVYSNAEIDNLFTQIGIPVSLNDSYADKQSELLANALLIITQQKPIYGSTAEDWELVNQST